MVKSFKRMSTSQGIMTVINKIAVGCHAPSIQERSHSPGDDRPESKDDIFSDQSESSENDSTRVGDDQIFEVERPSPIEHWSFTPPAEDAHTFFEDSVIHPNSNLQETIQKII